MSGRPRDGEWVPSTNIFVNYLPKNWTKANLVDLCSPYGPIQSAKVMIDLKTGASKGFGFVRYSFLESSISAVSALNFLQVGPKRLLARFAGSMENTGQSSHTLYVRSLPLFFSSGDIWNLFAMYGEIQEIALAVDSETGRFKGRAYVTYKYIECASEALQRTNNETLAPGQWPLFVQFSELPVEKEFLRIKSGQ